MTTQGHWVVRAHCAKLLGWDVNKIRVTASEIGGGFGGKTVVYLEPLALALSKKTGRPVKMVMSREEVFGATGPTSGATMRVKIGAKKDGTHHRRRRRARSTRPAPSRARRCSPACMCAFATYDIPNVKIDGYDVVSNRPKIAAYRAPGAPISTYAVESVVDETRRASSASTRSSCGSRTPPRKARSRLRSEVRSRRLVECLEAAKDSDALEGAARAEPGPRRRRRLLVQHRRRDHACRSQLNEDGTLTLMAGTPDIGGLRASLA